MMTAQRFLVPVDFSEYANQALEYAIGLASKFGARLTLLHVMQSPPWGGVDMDVTLPYAYIQCIQDLEAEIANSMQAYLACHCGWVGRGGCRDPWRAVP
jgi:nucleotide-binding universal stress UspA family protein